MDSVGSAGLVRHRLISRLADPGSLRVGRVVAPAGSGKSWLLAHVALAYPGPVGWCGSPDPVPRTEQALAEWLWDGLAPAITEAGKPGAGIQGLVDTLASPGPPVLIVIDDVHLLEGSDAEVALADLVRRLPARLRMLWASRVDLAFDVSRLRVSGQLVEIGPDDLRFRTWEVEELFRDVYCDPLVPEDAAALAHRTAGWAAYLQLFHLATAQKPPSERHQVLASLGHRSHLIWEYLARHALSDLSDELRDFLVRTSVLRRPTGALADELLGWSRGSSQVLVELERRQLFTERIDDDSYRYHPVLLSYLESRLVEIVGIAAARQEHGRAAALLEREGLTEDAAAAFAKAEDWEGVARMLGHPQGSGAGFAGAWLEALPPAVVETDSFFLMARSRRALASGGLAEAVATMRAAEAVAASSAISERCRQERDRVSAWMGPDAGVGTVAGVETNWLLVLRGATQRHPKEAQRAAEALPGASGRFVEGVAAFLSGDMLTASRLLRGVAAHPNAAPLLAAASRLMDFVAGSRSGRVTYDRDLERLRDEVEEVGVPWLDRMTRAAVTAADPVACDVLDDLGCACQREGDRWGEALVALVSCLARLSIGAPAVHDGRRATEIFKELGAGVLEMQAYAYLALAAHASGDAELAMGSATHARTLTSQLEAPELAGLAALALGRVLADEPELARARELLEPLGTWEWHRRLGLVANGRQNSGALRGDRDRTATPTSTAARTKRRHASADLAEEDGPPSVRLRCLGGFSLAVGGRPVDESGAKPMERALLHLLAMRAGEPVHREVLVEALWPGTAPEAGRHRLQVAVSSLRRLLGPHQRCQAALVRREGDAYRLALQEDVDIWQFEAHLHLRRAGGGPARRRGASPRSGLSGLRWPFAAS